MKLLRRLWKSLRTSWKTPTVPAPEAPAAPEDQFDDPEHYLPTRVPESKPPTRARTHVFVIGIDFGTSGTKVVFRDMTAKGRPAWAIDFGTELAGFSRFSLPSSIATSNGQFVFGSGAEGAGSESVLRSLKLAILNASSESAEVGELRSETPHAALLAGTPMFCSAAFLGAVIHQAERFARHVMPGRGRVEFYYNLDIPVDRLGQSADVRRFQTVLDAAIEFAHVEPRVARDIGSLWSFWREIVQRPETGRLDLARKAWTLVPESLAIIQGAHDMLSSEFADRERYKGIVDIGAGTTDVAWFKYVRGETENRLPFFAAGTRRVGCDDLDRGLVEQLVNVEPSSGSLLASVRAAKSELERGHSVVIDVGGGELRALTLDDLQRTAFGIGQRCFQAYGEIFGKAYATDRNTNSWANIQTLVVGGGSRISELRKRFRNHPRPTFGESVDLLRLDFTETLQAVGKTRQPPTAEDLVFLLPALGLSYPTEEMPKPIRPDEIAPLAARGTRPTGNYDHVYVDDS